jgi:hypothetical protein
MADNLNISVAAHKFQPIIVYFEEELDRELDGWNEARTMLKEEFKDRMRDIRKKGEEKIEEEQENGEVLK